MNNLKTLRPDTDYLVLGTGQVGTAILNGLNELGKSAVGLNRKSLDFFDYPELFKMISKTKAKVLFIAAGTSKGFIYNNSRPFTQYIDNATVLTNILRVSHESQVQLINILPSCIYPKEVHREIQPADLLSGALEETSLGYATAKLASAIAVANHNTEFGTRWVNIVLPNIYGSSQFENKDDLHLIPFAIQNLRESLSLGSAAHFHGRGDAVRDFLHVEDLSRSTKLLLNLDQFVNQTPYSLFNLGGASRLTTKDVVSTIANLLNFKGDIVFSNNSKSGPQVRILNSEFVRGLGWKPQIALAEGIGKLVRY